jgi:hypothetical protein
MSGVYDLVLALICWVFLFFQALIISSWTIWLSGIFIIINIYFLCRRREELSRFSFCNFWDYWRGGANWFWSWMSIFAIVLFVVSFIFWLVI